MNWTTVGIENLHAAQRLKQEGQWRSSVSRAYYAAFDVLNEKLLRFASPPEGFQTHRHRDVGLLIRKHLTALRPQIRRKLIATVTRLYAARLAADYNLRAHMDRAVALGAVRDAAAIVKIMGVKYGQEKKSIKTSHDR